MINYIYNKNRSNIKIVLQFDDTEITGGYGDLPTY